MHSSGELTSAMFDIESDGRSLTSFADLCSGFTSTDRLGVIIRHPLDAIWNSALICAAVTAFYDEQRETGNDFFIYPDYFVFHAGCPTGEYAMLDVWPPHKCVAVEDHPEAILQAVNDRAISILVLNEYAMHERAVRDDLLKRHTRNAALSRIRHAFLCQRHAPTADVQITGNAIVEKYVRQVIEQTGNSAQSERRVLQDTRILALRGGPAIELYKRVSVPEALSLL